MIAVYEGVCDLPPPLQVQRGAESILADGEEEVDGLPPLPPLLHCAGNRIPLHLLLAAQELIELEGLLVELLGGGGGGEEGFGI